jgi:ATP-dependent RNA helicase RhlE
MTSTFADLGVSRPVSDALAKRGINSPFPVQELVIADVLAGHDVLVQSPTGSGKTLAFGVPMLDSLDTAASLPRPAGLVLAPTRELARQIVDELESVARAKALRVAVVYGGVGIQPQIKAARKAHVLVATPGRLEDLIERRAVDLSRVRTLVLDEADRMLDMGFKPAVDRIVALTPSERQTLFFSATLEGAIGKVASAYTRDARSHTHAPPLDRGAGIEHCFVQMPTQAAKLDELVGQLRNGGGRSLVFVRTKRGADRLVKKLGTRGVKAEAMHGNKSQSQRQRALARFDSGGVDTLVATDVAARGIDVPDISHVINFDLPEDRDAYTHRVGRTGRAGRRGEGISYVVADQEHEMRGLARELDLLAEFDRRRGSEHRPPKGAGAGNGRKPSHGRSGGGRGHGRNGGFSGGSRPHSGGKERGGKHRQGKKRSGGSGYGPTRTVAKAGSGRHSRRG